MIAHAMKTASIVRATHIRDCTSIGYLFQVFSRASAMLITQTHIELGFAVASICCQFEAGIACLVMAFSHTFNPWEENGVKIGEKNRMQPQMQQTLPRATDHPCPMPNGPAHSLQAHQPPSHIIKVSTGKTATQYFRNYSDLIAKKDCVLAQHMVNGEAVYFSSAATSGVCRAGSFFLDHYIFLQLFLELQFCNCFFSLPGRLRSQTMKKEL